MKIGDRVIHEEFGEGVIDDESITHKNHFWVLFKDGVVWGPINQLKLTLIRQPLSTTDKDCDELKRIKADMKAILNLTYQDGNNAKGKIQVIAKRWL